MSIQPVDTTAFQTWLDTTVELTDETITAEQVALARSIISHEGMRVIWGLMLGSAQGRRVELENAPLGTAQESCRAAVIQGGIKGIYVLRDTLLELVNMGRSAAPNEGEE